MAAVARKGDSCTGHADFVPRASISGSPDVFCNGIPVLRQGDGFAVHCNPVPLCHASSLAGGSSFVFVNGKPLGRVGDGVGCGGSVANGSSNVFCEA